MDFSNERTVLNYAKQGAEELGVTLSEFLLLFIANKLDDLPTTIAESRED